MKGIILYQSKYGATKKYADWISEATGFECVETKKANIKEVEKYDIIVLGGGIYAMGIAGLSFLKRNIDVLSDKKIIVFFCCASPYALSDRKLKAAKKQLLGQLAISGDNGETQCLSMGKSLLAYGKITSGQETRELIERISAADIQEMARTVFDISRLSKLVYV